MQQRRISLRKGARYLFALPCAALVSTLLVATMGPTGEGTRVPGRVPLAATDLEAIDCVPPGIESFPPDFLSQEQRRHGGVLIHVAIACYACAMTAIVCDSYFVPALEAIAAKLQLSPDVAGATFMAMGASAPELFSSIAGSFITEDDIGLGTILGSAVFNILGISGIVGIVAWDQALEIRRYPVIRDCIVYGMTVLVLGYIISDNVVRWWEALVLLLIFSSYIILMHFNQAVERAAFGVVEMLCPSGRGHKGSDPERGPLLADHRSEAAAEQDTREGQQPEGDDEEGSACFCSPVCRVLMCLPSILFRLTIPPVHYYPATFLVSVLWMGALSYVTVWMVTIIGYTLSIPDAVAGLTLLAAGSSVPDLIATVLVARSGEGNMAVSNLLGSNTFDLAFCLGAPWLVKSLVSGRGRLLVYSSAMVYTAATLLLSLAALPCTLILTGWRLNRTSGFVFASLYLLCITLSCLYELNVFGDINLPTCTT